MWYPSTHHNILTLTIFSLYSRIRSSVNGVFSGHPRGPAAGLLAHGRGGVGRHRHSALHRGREVRRRRLSAGAKAAAAGKSKNEGGAPINGDIIYSFC